MKLTIAFTVAILVGLAIPTAQGANLTWNGATSTNWSAANWTGGTPVSSGTDALSFAGSANTATINDLTGYTATAITFISGAAGFSLSGTDITLTGGVTNSSSTAQTINLGLALTVGGHNFSTAGNNMLITGIISGSGGLNKTSNNTLVLSGTNNSYLGATNINQGNLNVTKLTNGGSNSSIGASSSSAVNILFPNSTGVLNYTGAGDSTDRLFTASGGIMQVNSAGTSGALVFTNTGAIAFGTADQARLVKLGGANTANNTFDPLLQNNGTAAVSFTKEGNGKWILTNANTFSGTTTVSAGILQLNNRLALQNSTLVTTNSVTGSATAGISLTTGTDLVLGGLTGTKNLATLFTSSNGYANVTSLTLNPGSGISNSYSGIIADGATGMGLIKTGSGTQTLAGANTYTGLTTISAGTLVLSGSGSIDNSSGVNLGTTASPGTLDLTAKAAYTFSASQTVSGAGTINIGAGKTVTIDGNLNPGNSPGVLNVTGALTLSGTTTMEVNGMTGPGTNFDQVVVSEMVTFGGDLVFSFSSLQPTGTVLLFDAATYAGDFANVTALGSYGALTFIQTGDIWSASANSQTLSFDQISGELNIAAIPEPASLALLSLSLFAGLLFVRRIRPA